MAGSGVGVGVGGVGGVTAGGGVTGTVGAGVAAPPLLLPPPPHPAMIQQSHPTRMGDFKALKRFKRAMSSDLGRFLSMDAVICMAGMISNCQLLGERSTVK